MGKPWNRPEAKAYQSSEERRAYRRMLVREQRRLGIYGRMRELGIELKVEDGVVVGFATAEENRRRGGLVAGQKVRLRALCRRHISQLAAPKPTAQGKP